MGIVTDTITLKDDYTFLVSDHSGDVTNGPEGHGMYMRDTRYLSHFDLVVNGRKPHALSYTADYNIAATFRMSTSHEVEALGDMPGETYPRMISHAVGITRRRYINQGLIESLMLLNYHPVSLDVSLAVRVGADFADIFEVRGMPREEQDHSVAVEVSEKGRNIVFRSVACSLDRKLEVDRSLHCTCSRTPDVCEENSTTSPLNGTTLPEITLYFNLHLQPHKPLQIDMRLVPVDDGVREPKWSDSQSSVHSFDDEVARMRSVFTSWLQACTGVETGNYLLDQVFKTGTLDLRSLMQQGPRGLVVTAGLPWYFTLFGRDSLLTALETLPLNPRIAVDTMRALAAYQATEYGDWRDMEPGKILHELRLGDMTLTGEMPHSPYYGSVDSTLLFILTFTEALKWLDDPALFRELWPNVQRALGWAEKYGDADDDGYIEFKRRSKRGILHQGWKDSDESIGGDLGPRPAQPLALVEVQGYYYAALVGLAETLRRYGGDHQEGLANRLREKAHRLKEQFNRDFWWPEEGFLVQALDANKKQVRAVTSNPGHCLWNGIVDTDKAARVIERLMQPDMLSGWGVRTMSTYDASYNPMSYHNGSIWPHDNALLVAGMRRYGFQNEMLKVAGEILDAATTYPHGRLPELYCGFERGSGGLEDAAPAAYPVSCSPQAWAAGTPTMLLQALLGMEVDAGERALRLSPKLPDSVDDITLTGLTVGRCRVNLALWRDPSSGEYGMTFSGVDAAAPELQVILLRAEESGGG